MIVQLIVASGSRTGQVIPVPPGKFIIGRAVDCHLISKSELVSRYHCAILVDNDVVVRDLGSQNGVRLNGEKITADCKLNTGDNLVLGPLSFYVNIIDADEPEEGSRNTVSHLHDGPCVEAAEATVVLSELNKDAQ